MQAAVGLAPGASEEELRMAQATWPELLGLLGLLAAAKDGPAGPASAAEAPPPPLATPAVPGGAGGADQAGHPRTSGVNLPGFKTVQQPNFMAAAAVGFGRIDVPEIERPNLSATLV